VIDPLGIVVDADRPEHERVAWLSRLRDATEPATIAQLVALLNEPLEWLGREVLADLGERARRGAEVFVGVDGRGLIAASPTPSSSLIDDRGTRVCPVLGAVVGTKTAAALVALAPRLAAVPQWLASPVGAGSLRRVDDDHVGELIALGDVREIELGSAPHDERVVVTVAGAAPRHARVVVRDGRVIVIDLKSATGTFVNGKRIASPQVLRVGDRVALGASPVFDVVATLPSSTPLRGPLRHAVRHASIGGLGVHELVVVGARTVEPGGAGHLVILSGERRAVVSYAEPIAQILDHDADATVGSVRTRGLVRLERIPARATTP
jgi:hypothetical protein